MKLNINTSYISNTNLRDCGNRQMSLNGFNENIESSTNSNISMLPVVYVNRDSIDTNEYLKLNNISLFNQEGLNESESPIISNVDKEDNIIVSEWVESQFHNSNIYSSCVDLDNSLLDSDEFYTVSMNNEVYNNLKDSDEFYYGSINNESSDLSVFNYNNTSSISSDDSVICTSLYEDMIENKFIIFSVFTKTSVKVKDIEGVSRTESQYIAKILLCTHINGINSLFTENSVVNTTIHLVRVYLFGVPCAQNYKEVYPSVTVYYHNIGIEEFLNHTEKYCLYLKDKSNNDLSSLDINPIICFIGITWSNVAVLLRLKNIIVNGGSITSRHKLSILDLRLSRFVSLLGKSFINKDVVHLSSMDKLLTGTDIPPLFKGMGPVGTNLSESVLSSLNKKTSLDYKLVKATESFVGYLKNRVFLNELTLSLLSTKLGIQTEGLERVDSIIKEGEISIDQSLQYLAGSGNLDPQVLEKQYTNPGKREKKMIFRSKAHNLDIVASKKRIAEAEAIRNTIIKERDATKELLDAFLIRKEEFETADVENQSVKDWQKAKKDKATVLNREIKLIGRKNHWNTKFKSINREYSTLVSSPKNLEIGSDPIHYLKRLLLESPLNSETQKDIEYYLIDLSSQIIKNNLQESEDGAINYSIINKPISIAFKSAELDLQILLNNFRHLKIAKNKIENNKKAKASFLLQGLIQTIPNDKIIAILLGRLLRIISNSHLNNNNTVFGLVNLDLVKELLNQYYLSEYESQEVKSENESFATWKSKFKLNNDLEEKLKDDTLLFIIGSILIEFLLDCELLNIYLFKQDPKKHVNILVPGKKLSSILDKSEFFIYPSKLPMIVKPGNYYREIRENGEISEHLGGYLLNGSIQTTPLMIENWELKNNSIISDDNLIYDMVNNISSVGFTINTKVLDYILENGVRFNMILDRNYKHPLLLKVENNIKLNMSEERELASYLSRKHLEENILGIAFLYRDVPEFFIPVRIDNRGRLYCQTNYLHYQSVELAKAIISFSKKEKVSKSDTRSIDYLKIFGANCFGNKIDKSSFEQRVSWVNDNHENIMDFNNGILIQKAKNKLLFIAFCFEYRNYINSLKNSKTYFYTQLPIQLDATCNGYQHLAMLIGDEKLGIDLNLGESTWKELPHDFYYSVILFLKRYFERKVLEISKNEKHPEYENLENYIRIRDSNLDRTLIKTSIMTKPYNVTLYQMSNYIKNQFKYTDNRDWNEDKDNKVVWLENIDNPNLKLTSFDILLLAKAIDTVIYSEFPKLLDFTKYLKNIARLCTELNIAIPWKLPTGLNISQEYISTDSVQLKPFIYKKTTFNLNIPNRSKTNKMKQIRALMPNLVHSLDAASLALLTSIFFKNSDAEVNNIFTVHDCFAISMNNVDKVMSWLKIVYITLYSNDQYLLDFDNGIRETIKLHYGPDSFDAEKLKVLANEKYHDFPNISAVIKTANKLDRKEISKAAYIIN